MPNLRAIVAPELGLESDETLRVSLWLVEPGDEVVEGDRIVELICRFATFDVAAPATGRLHDVLVRDSRRTEPGQTLGHIAVEPNE